MAFAPFGKVIFRSHLDRMVYKARLVFTLPDWLTARDDFESDCSYQVIMSLERVRILNPQPWQGSSLDALPE